MRKEKTIRIHVTLSLIFGVKNGYFQFVTVKLSLFKVKATFIVQAKREREIYMKVVQVNTLG